MREPWTARVAATILGVSGATTALPAGVLLLSGFASPRNWLLLLPVAAVAAAFAWTAYGVRQGRPRARLAAVVLVVALVVVVDADAVTGRRLPLAAAVWSVAGFVALACLVSPSYRSWSHLVTALGPAPDGPAPASTSRSTSAPDGTPELSPRRRAGGARGRGRSSGRTSPP